jgi:hypothetical protein
MRATGACRLVSCLAALVSPLPSPLSPLPSLALLLRSSLSSLRSPVFTSSLLPFLVSPFIPPSLNPSLIFPAGTYHISPLSTLLSCPPLLPCSPKVAAAAAATAAALLARFCPALAPLTFVLEPPSMPCADGPFLVRRCLVCCCRTHSRCFWCHFLQPQPRTTCSSFRHR